MRLIDLKLSEEEQGHGLHRLCVICRDVTQHVFVEHPASPLRRFLPLGRPKRIMLACKRCATERDYEREILMREAAGMPSDPLVIDEDDPHSKKGLDVTFTISHFKGKVNPKDRRVLMWEPFLAMASAVESNQMGSMNIEGMARVGCLAALVSPILALAALVIGEATSALGVLVGGVILAICTLIYLGHESGRRLKETVEPTLARMLTPTQPTLDELKCVVRDLRAQGFKIGFRVDAERILALIQKRDPDAKGK